MADVYSNAFLVIAASGASDSTKGCFATRTPFELMGSRPFYTAITPIGQSIPILLRFPKATHKIFHPNTYYSADRTPKFPLLNRAWVFQERLLATRVVHFSGGDLVWECRKGTQCDCMGLDFVIDQPCMKGRFVSEIGLSRANRISFWHKLLAHYTSLSITVPFDVFPSLSGVVKQIQTAGSGAYLAGLWKDAIFE